MVSTHDVRARLCAFCEKPTPDYHNYCGWDCIVGLAKREGGKVVTPNGLPIRSVRADNTMLEHEHADHPDYRFPVTVEYIGKPLTLPDWDPSLAPHDHALIYTDGDIALTLHECTYHLWSLHDGKTLGDTYYKRNQWRLTDEALAKINRERELETPPSENEHQDRCESIADRPS